MDYQITIQERLSQFGLTSMETSIYLHLLLYKHPQTISEIAKALALPRTSIYDNTLRLVKKGLLENIVKYKAQSFVAAPLDMLQILIDKEKERTDGLEKTLLQLKTMIAEKPSSPAYTEVKYYHDKQGLMQMMWNALSAKDEMIGYSSLGRFKIVGQKFITRWYEEATQRNIRHVRK